MARYFTGVLFGLVLIGLASCSKDRKAGEDKTSQPAANTAPATKAASNTDDVYESTCAPCHGANGKGDGPMGRSLRVADLSSADWQQRVSDEEIAEVITKGRGKMPAFNMPPDKVDALVQKVRSFRK